MPTVAYPPDVFTWPADEPQLIAGRCADCQAIAFPVATSCPRCGSIAAQKSGRSPNAGSAMVKAERATARRRLG